MIKNISKKSGSKRGEIKLKSRDELLNEAKELVEIITVYKVLKKEQLYAVIKNKDDSVKQSIIRYLDRKDRIFIHDGIISADENWSKYYDKGLIKAFWILLDFKDDVIFNKPGDFPVKIEFVTANGEYNIIVAEKGQENMLNTFFKKVRDKNAKHLVVVQDEEQMYKFTFPNISAFCIVEEDGNVSYYM